MKTTPHYARYAVLATAGLLGLLTLAACDTAPASPEGKTEMRRSSAEALNQAQQNDPTLRPIIRAAAGYAVFPSIGKGAIGVGGAYGKGGLYDS